MQSQLLYRLKKYHKKLILKENTLQFKEINRNSTQVNVQVLMEINLQTLKLKTLAS